MKKLFISLLLTLACAAGAWSQTVTETYRIKQMRCEDCAHKVMVAVTQDPGVSDINFNLERRTATITYDKSKTCLDSLKGRLAHTRYRLSAYDPHEVIRRGIGFHIAELSDEGKAQQISEALYRIQGVDSVAPHVDKQWVFVRYDANRTEKQVVRNCLTALGYTPVNYYTSADISYAQFPCQPIRPPNRLQKPLSSSMVWTTLGSTRPITRSPSPTLTKIPMRRRSKRN